MSEGKSILHYQGKINFLGKTCDRLKKERDELAAQLDKYRAFAVGQNPRSLGVTGGADSLIYSYITVAYVRLRRYVATLNKEKVSLKNQLQVECDAVVHLQDKLKRKGEDRWGN